MKKLHHTLLALAATALTLGAAQAADFNFSGVLEDGALVGQSFSGVFSYDETLPHGTDDSLPLTGLAFSFGGSSYTLLQADADSTYVNFIGGELIGFDALYSGSTTLTFSPGFGQPYLAYSVGNDFGGGSYSISAVPEPSTWLLGLGGLAVIGAAAARRRARTSA